MESYFQWSLAVFWLMAFSSATHDIAADGYYMLALEQHQQAAFVGVRSTFYRIAMITGQGALVYLAGYLELHAGSIATAWSITFFVLAGLFLSIAIYHRFVLPYPVIDKSVVEEASAGAVLKEFLRTFGSFFKKKEIIVILGFLLFYRFAEAQLVKLVTPFLLDARADGGLGLTTSDVGIAYGTVGVICLTLGGLLGGYVISKKGLKFWLWIMVFAIHLPDTMFVYLSYVQPESFALICAAIGIEQFGYGFGFTAYMMYMVMISDGPYKTAHYAICTGFMALGMMIPGMFSGKLQDAIGYQHFFLWVMASTIPGFIVALMVKIDPEFGKKKA